ncbi:MAG: hypothetical protein AAGG59_13435 [Bacteroidota bacterium]
MKRLLLILMVFLALGSVYAQSYADKLEIVKLLEGNWEGNLNYLNFQDDETRGTVDLQISGKRKGDAVTLQYTYFNNGEVVREGSDKVVADNNNAKFNFNDTWDLDSFKKNEDGTYEFVLSTRGKDNNKKALMRKTVNISASEFTIARDIKYLKGDAEFFNRHIYTLKKK